MGKTTYLTNPKRIEKLSRNEQLDLLFDLINAFSSVTTPFENALLIQDLLTVSEVKNLSIRLRIAKLLIAGETQRNIAKNLRCSIATVTKVAFWLAEGGEGLKKAVSKLPLRYDFPNKLTSTPIEFHLPQAIFALAQYSLANKQGRDIKGLEELLQNLGGKAAMDKSLQEAFNQEFIKLTSERKRAKFISQTSK